jgi:predicted nucleic acid-binding Zn ribbon protein
MAYYSYKCNVYGLRIELPLRVDSPYENKHPQIIVETIETGAKTKEVLCPGKFYREYQATSVILKGTGWTKGHVN